MFVMSVTSDLLQWRHFVRGQQEISKIVNFWKTLCWNFFVFANFKELNWYYMYTSFHVNLFTRSWEDVFWRIFTKSMINAKSHDKSKIQGLGARELIGPDHCAKFEICRSRSFWVLGEQKNGPRRIRSRRRRRKKPTKAIGAHGGMGT